MLRTSAASKCDEQTEEQSVSNAETTSISESTDVEGVGPYRYARSKKAADYEPKQTRGIRRLFTAAVDNTTIHGFPNYGQARGGLKKSFWLTVLVLMSGGLLCSVHELVTKYLQYKVKVNIDVKEQQELVFPAVTVCNMSPVKKSAMQTQHVTVTSSSSSTGNKILRRRKRGGYSPCPSGWSQHNGNCYIQKSHLLGMSNAQNWCQNQGAQLVSISDVDELNYINNVVTSVSSAWIGLMKTNPTVNSATYWLDGNPSTYRAWNSGKPSSSGQCVVLTSAGGFSDQDCGNLLVLACICKMPISTTLGPTPTNPAVTSVWTTSVPRQTEAVTTSAAIQTTSTTATTTKTSSSSSSSTSSTTTTLTTKITTTNPMLSTVAAFSTATAAAASGEAVTSAQTTATTLAPTALLSTNAATTPEQSTTPFQTITREPVTATTTSSATTVTASSAKPTVSHPETTKTEMLTSIPATSAVTTSNPLSTKEWSSPLRSSLLQVTNTSTRSNYSSTSAYTHCTSPASYDNDRRPTISSLFVEDTTTMKTAMTSSLVRCCCRCCFSSSAVASASRCSHCARDSVENASSCAVGGIPDDEQGARTASTTDPASFHTSTVKPFSLPTAPRFKVSPPIPESIYPERLSLTNSASEIQTLTEKLASLPLPLKQSISFTQDDLIVDCTFGGNPCNSTRDFTQFYNPIHGNCYIFNSGWDVQVSAITRSKHPGRKKGLSLVLNVQQWEYIEQVGSTAGIIVLPMRQNVMPFPEDDGLVIRPGRSISIGLSMKSVERISEPYGTCMEGNENDVNSYSRYFPVEYSIAACLKTCYQRLTIESCGCSDPYYPVDVNAAVSVCSSSNITQSDCLYEISRRLSSESSICSCPPGCRDVEFKSQLSSAAWLSIRSKSQLMQYLRPKLPSTFFDDGNEDLIKNNLVEVDVFFLDFVVADVRQSPGYTKVQLLIDFGGAVGLWLGLSVMSFTELVEFIADVVIFACQQIYVFHRRNRLAATMAKYVERRQ